MFDRENKILMNYVLDFMLDNHANLNDLNDALRYGWHYPDKTAIKDLIHDMVSHALTDSEIDKIIETFMNVIMMHILYPIIQNMTDFGSRDSIDIINRYDANPNTSFRSIMETQIDSYLEKYNQKSLYAILLLEITREIDRLEDIETQ
jgi:hypothetical protein